MVYLRAVCSVLKVRAHRIESFVETRIDRRARKLCIEWFDDGYQEMSPRAAPSDKCNRTKGSENQLNPRTTFRNSDVYSKALPIVSRVSPRRLRCASFDRGRIFRNRKLRQTGVVPLTSGSLNIGETFSRTNETRSPVLHNVRRAEGGIYSELPRQFIPVKQNVSLPARENEDTDISPKELTAP